MEQNETQRDLAYVRETLASCRPNLHPDSPEVRMIDASFNTIDRLEKQSRETITPAWIDEAALEYARRFVTQSTTKVQLLFIEAMTRASALSETLDPATGAVPNITTPGAWREARRSDREKAIAEIIETFTEENAGELLDALLKPYDAEIARMIGECRKAMSDWHRFQDFIVGEGPEEFFRLNEAWGEDKQKGVIERFMKYLTNLWNAKRQTEDRLAGMTEARDRFNAAVNNIANIFGHRDKQCYAPEAVERWAQEIVDELDRLNRIVKTVGEVIDGHTIAPKRVEVRTVYCPEWIQMTERKPTAEDGNWDGRALFKFADGTYTSLRINSRHWSDATHWARLDDKRSGPETNVHTRHCCVTHGCKYGDESCPVTTGRAKQETRCGQLTVCGA